MSICARAVSRKSADYSKIKALYTQAFPKHERVPFPLIQLMALKKNIDFLAIYDDETFIGLVYLITDRGERLLYYFAIDPSLRSKGYGSQVLQWLKAQNNLPLAIIMETVREDAENLGTRLKRQNFYEKNGLFDTGFYLRDQTGVFDILSEGESFSSADFVRRIRKFAFWDRGIEVQSWARAREV